MELELPISGQAIDQSFWQKNGVTRILVVDDEEAVCLPVEDGVHLLPEAGEEKGLGEERVHARFPGLLLNFRPGSCPSAGRPLTRASGRKTA